MQLTVITPCSPDHEPLLPLAAASVTAQTVACQHLVEVDYARQGPGVIRNRLLKQVETEYVTFLDADDWLAPDFAALTLGAMQAGRYVYTDWWQDDHAIKAPHQAWCGGSWHLVTAVVPTQAALAVGGFDERLIAMEDTDFYLKLVTRMVCGIRVDKTLVHYRANGGRSKAVHEDGRIKDIRKFVGERYRHMPSCCGGGQMDLSQPVNEYFEGAVLSQALWSGNRPERGRASGLRYPRMSNPVIAWIHADDVKQSPNLWRPVGEVTQARPVTSAPRFQGLDGLAQAMRDNGVIGEPRQTVQPGDYTPDFQRVIRIASERLNG